MKNEDIFDAITGIREDIVERAETYQFQKQKGRWKKWILVAAGICILVVGTYGVARTGLLGRMLRHGSDARGRQGISYMSYAGPVFPLTTREPAEGLTTERRIDFDFSLYNPANQSIIKKKSLVTDEYKLTNTTSHDITVTALYPFAGKLDDAKTVLPDLRIDGVSVEADLYVGPYSGGYDGTWDNTTYLGSQKLDRLDSWLDYKALFEAGYVNYSMNELPELTQNVIVYEFTNPSDMTDEEISGLTLAVSMEVDFLRTSILSYDFNSYRNENGANRTSGTIRLGSSLPMPGGYRYGKPNYIIVLGEDIKSYEAQYLRNGSLENGEVAENLSGNVTRYETSLNEILNTILDTYSDAAAGNRYNQPDSMIKDVLSRQTYLGLVAEHLLPYSIFFDAPVARYGSGSLNEVFAGTDSAQRVMYLEFAVTIPANGSVEIEADMTKDASRDYTGKKKERNGYDMLTRLGSNLEFTSQTASISNTEFIEIIEQNFGFNPDTGITKVELDVNEEHYWLDIKKRETEK